VGKGRLKERCGLESQNNFFFSFKKSPKTECRLDSRIYGIPLLPLRAFVVCYSANFIFYLRNLLTRVSATEPRSERKHIYVYVESMKRSRAQVIISARNLCNAGYSASDCCLLYRREICTEFYVETWNTECTVNVSFAYLITRRCFVTRAYFMFLLKVCNGDRQYLL
jgi:hypothetical protein